MKRLICLIIFISITTFSFSQKRTFIGIEGSLTNDFNDIVNNTELKGVPLLSGRYGIIIKQDLNNFISIETGIFYKYYEEGASNKSVKGSYSSSLFGAFCIPIRFNAKINLYKEKIFFTPVLGVSFCFVPERQTINNSVYYSSSYGSNSNILNYYKGNYFGKTNGFMLIQTGFAIDFNFKNNCSLSVFSSFYNGLTIISNTYFSYNINNSNLHTAQILSRGSFWDVLGVSYKFPISNLWQKNKK